MRILLIKECGPLQLTRQFQNSRLISVIATAGTTATIMLEPLELNLPTLRAVLEVFPPKQASEASIEMHAQRDRIVIYGNVQHLTRLKRFQRAKNAPMTLSPRNFANIDRENLTKLCSHRVYRPSSAREICRAWGAAYDLSLTHAKRPLVVSAQRSFRSSQSVRCLAFGKEG